MKKKLILVGKIIFVNAEAVIKELEYSFLVKEQDITDNLLNSFVDAGYDYLIPEDFHGQINY